MPLSDKEFQAICDANPKLSALYKSLRARENLKFKQRKGKEFSPVNLHDFITFHKTTYESQWFHRFICEKMDAVIAGKIKRLLITVPPRHGKSEIISRYAPPYILGKDPNRKIIATSHTADLSNRINRDVQKIIDSARYARCFPKTKLNSKNVRNLLRDNDSHGSTASRRNSSELEIIGYEGSYRNCGVGGSITGSGADIILIDDPIKDWKQAFSPTYRQATKEWFDGTLSTRLDDQDNGVIVLIMTRWHEDDLAGALMDEAAKNPDMPQWDVVNIPAMYSDKIESVSCDRRKDGESLWDKRITAKKLVAIKNSRPRVFASLYQGQPSPDGGEIFKDYYWQFYDSLPRNIISYAQTWDLTFGSTSETASFVSGFCIATDGINHYLVDRTTARASYKATKDMIRSFSKRHPKALRKLVEAKANGPAVISDLEDEIDGLIPYMPRGNKKSRAMPVADLAESGNIYLPNPESAEWVVDFIMNAKKFRGVDNERNDDIDALSQYINDFLSNRDIVEDEEFGMAILT